MEQQKHHLHGKHAHTHDAMHEGKVNLTTLREGTNLYLNRAEAGLSTIHSVNETPLNVPGKKLTLVQLVREDHDV